MSERHTASSHATATHSTALQRENRFSGDEEPANGALELTELPSISPEELEWHKSISLLPTCLDHTNQREDVPLPLRPRFLLSDVADEIRSALPETAHLSLAVRYKNSLHFIVEVANSPSEMVHRAKSLVESIAVAHSPELHPIVHTIEISGAATPAQRAGIRSCKVRNLLLSKVCLVNRKFSTVYPVGIPVEYEPPTQLQKFLREATSESLTHQGNPAHRLYESSDSLTLPELASRIATKFWGISQQDIPHYAFASSLEVDADIGTLRVIRDEPGLTPQACHRIRIKLSGPLAELNGNLSVLASTQSHDISSFISFHVKNVAKAHRISLHGERIQLHVLLDPSEKESSLQKLAPLRKQIGEISKYSLDIFHVVNRCEITEILFRALPIEWGFCGVLRSNDNKRLLIKSRTLRDRIEEPELVDLLNSEFPEGVFFNSNHQTNLSPSDPLYSDAFQSLPGRCDLRGILQCEVTGALTLQLKEAAPEVSLKRLSEITGVPVDTILLSKPQPPNSLRPVLGWLSSQNGRIDPVSQRVSDTMHFEGRGGCKMVGGSCLSLSFGGVNFLLDCGSWLGQRRDISIPDELLRNLHFGVISHHHTDHVGGLLRAMQLGLSAPLLMTRATAIAMYPIMQEQAQRQGIPRAEIEKLYRNLVRTIPYRTPIKLSDSLKLTFLDAGHIVGSALTRFDYDDGVRQHSVLYTGDYRSESTRLHDGADLVAPVDTIIAEGTYGTNEQPDRALEEEKLKRKIRATVLKGGTVVVPLLASGRAQEVLSIFSDEAQWLRENNIPVYLRGAVNTSNEIYSYLVNDDPNNFTSRVTEHNNWLSLAKLVNASRPSFSNNKPSSRSAPKTDSLGKILFVSGGMIQGQAEKLVREYCHDPKNLLVFTCFQVPGTLGRRILDYHQKVSRVLPEIENFNMDVYCSQLSAHSSGSASVDYVKKTLKPGGTVILVHGELSALNDYAEALRATNIPGRVIVPGIGEPYTFSH